MDAMTLLESERARKTALRESFERQLVELGRRREGFAADRAALDRDLARLRPPAKRLQDAIATLDAQDRKAEAEERRIRVDINALQKEIRTLEHQIGQLNADDAETSP